jgi:hypothetical protein
MSVPGRPAPAPREARAASVVLAALTVLTMGSSVPELSRTLPDTGLPSEARVGTTFSPWEAEDRGLDYQEAYERLLDSPLQVIRLGSFWSEVEAHGWGRLDWLVHRALEADKKVVIVVGVKSPRWPEFWAPARLHLADAPAWSRLDQFAPGLRSEALGFITEVVLRYRDRPHLVAWQVENEPLDPAGRDMSSLSDELLAAEVDLVRSLDGRPVALTFYLPLAMKCDFGRLGDCPMSLAAFFPVSGDRLLNLLEPGDVLGIDVYTSIGSAQVGDGWQSTVAEWQQRAREAGVDLWVTEAQAEPWPTVTSGGRNAQIVTAQRSLELYDELEAMGIGTILLWGSEHWLSQIQHDDRSWEGRFLLSTPIGATDSH